MARCGTKYTNPFDDLRQWIFLEWDHQAAHLMNLGWHRHPKSVVHTVGVEKLVTHKRLA